MIKEFCGRVTVLWPGILLAGTVAIAAQFISDHYGAPAMLMALLLGISLHFLADQPKCGPGISFASRSILRVGIALLGTRISFAMVEELGWEVVGMTIVGVVSTIGFGLIVGRLIGFGPRFSFLSAGSVAICGASAALAISAVLPKDERSEERLAFTVVGVTVLSTIAMVVYPIVADLLNFNPEMAGVFLGATIHDVAQVVGAGFSVSQETGEVATVVKLLRVSMLAPVVFLAALMLRRKLEDSGNSEKKPPLLPTFVIVFFALMAANSMGFIPTYVSDLSSSLSRWGLLTAIAAVGINTSLQSVLNVGRAAISLLVLETLFIATLIILLLNIMN